MTAQLFLVCDRAEPPRLIVTGAFAGAPPAVTYTQQAADFDAVANDIADGGTNTGAYEIDASANPVVANLPPNPDDCDRVLLRVTDNTNEVQVNPNGSTIQNVTGNLILSTNVFLNKNVLFEYSAANGYWTATS